MPYILEDLVIDRVDLVDEGANSAAFIELYKRKEQSKMNFDEILSKMKPEHAKVIKGVVDTLNNDLAKAKEDLTTVTAERDTASEDLAKAKDELNAVNDELAKANSELKKRDDDDAKGDDDKDDADEGDVDKANSGASFDEAEVIKSMPEAAREMFQKMQAQKDAAEEELRKAKEAESTAKAVAKAKELKSIPVEQDKLVDIIKRADADVIGILETVNAAVEGVVLNEVGKSTGSSTTDAWSKIDKKADEIVERDSVSKAKAISTVIKENPELYREYLQGGAK